MSAQAALLGPGHGDLNGAGTVGAFVAESDGRQVYCLDSGAPSPLNSPTSGPTTVTDITNHTGGQLSKTALAKLNYVLSRWGDSQDPNITAAVQLFVWDIGDPDTYHSHGMHGDAWFIRRVPTAYRDAVLANLGAMRAEAEANHAVDPTVSLSIAMQDQFNGSLTVALSTPALSGNVVLTDAVFLDGTSSRALGSGTYPIVGKPAVGAPQYQIEASASYSGAGLGARVNLYETPGAQRLLANGTPAAVTAAAQTPWIALDFQPVIGTTVAAKFVADGEPFVDLLTVSTVGTGAWINVDGHPVPLTAKGTLYGPFDEQPAQSEKVPDGAPVVGSETVLLDRGTGEYRSPGTLRAPGSGFYTWVWQIDKAAQGQNGKYIRASFIDHFGRVTETHVGPFQPEAVSKADARLAVPGDEVTDTITVSSTNGAWLKIAGVYIPVVLDGTAYQVAGSLPPIEQTGVPSDAKVLGRVQVTATGPGIYTSPPVLHPDAGFVTWVWEVKLSSQPAQYRDYIADNWADNFGIPVESTSVRWPGRVTSEVREYNVHPGGRAFDTITVSGFPDNHGDFTGDGYWGSDVDVITHTVYGPFESDTVLTDDIELEGAPVLMELSTPARNGTYKLGYTDSDEIRPTDPGYYVVVSDFVGDDRVQPYRSSPGDILERFYVPPPPPSPVSVVTQATPDALVGDPIRDHAIVTGTVPAGSTLVFRAYGPFPEQPAAADEPEPFYTSEPVPVNGPGTYDSGKTKVDKPGLVFWIETLYGPDGQVLAEGFFGAPGETTIISARPAEFTVSTGAVPEVTLGQPAHDVATVTGDVPKGAVLAFQAYRQTGKTPVCEAKNLAFDTHDTLTPVTGPGDYTSAETVFEQAGTYFWIETLYTADGTMLHRGTCGADNETTTVLDTPPPSPSEPLARTGAGREAWAAAGLALALIAAGGTALWARRAR
ncbi:hypothetical protein G7067_05730 [Leucobacter insecticola]|uniref:Gram-positive cocci surface proteins LPxTG domain-containing protein n=1 Tax=Leucobacter insecticola TaxID=2714934 RepID=A0A6G8FIB7_9MICO|nr:hypothetical protein [Leucobacter insecticola]QIM16029.1 hypothetical protein G7067_05730 [Leucobacter insecticola]